METRPINRRVRTVVFLAIAVGAVGFFMVSREDPEANESATFEESSEYQNAPDQTSETPPRRPPRRSTIESTEDAKPELTSITFLDFVEQYAANRENFRAKDSLTALVVNKHVQWEGYVRNVTRHPTSFYVTVWSAESYNGPSASITFDHDMEDKLYALQPNDRVRFEGIVTRAAGSVGIEGLEIEVTD